MKKLVFFLILFYSSLNFSQTQAEMNKEAYEAFQKSDNELSTVYKEILNLYKADTTFIESLRKSQRIWIQFRDAELEMKYPNHKIAGYYGSSHPMCRAYYLKELTDKRFATLKIWIKGIEEGNMCSGSVRIK